jgi:hypothetical protein
MMGPDGEFITGSDFLMDGGVTAAYRFGELAAVAGEIDSHLSALGLPRTR